VLSGIGAEHGSEGRDWGYAHLDSNSPSPRYGSAATRAAIRAAATGGPGWLAAMPTAVKDWVLTFGTSEQDRWRDMDRTGLGSARHRYHLGGSSGEGPEFTVTAAIITAAQSSESAWLAALPADVVTWGANYSASDRTAWRTQDGAP
jgi:hypothetical protein